ncbi:sodium-dependent bicarbonate transport family permease [Thiohalocapsa halophila]|uniref:Sodium-dependent bicarbonate transport family permease n=1 Tax=Thiohalocapsa halophila TaxID=69359 RepID=A0ABS1CLF2_9GAMM|nr:sodium-dependent bicarbonate transport family permease [Thiohalocapsa halophila]MBK1632747.1 sodium-dependent bicarbonate transport family permease [Thiohalocapsa halophila]
MDALLEFLTRFVSQLQSPTLGFLLGGMIIAALGSRLEIPDAIYKFIVFMLLMKVGLKGGMKIREAELSEMLLPAIFALAMGMLIVFIGRYTLAMLPNVKTEDGIATAGLFGAVSGSTLAAALAVLESENIAYEAWSVALYPFMDIPALVTAIVLASLYLNKKRGNGGESVKIWPIVKESLQGSALSALLLGIALGLITQPAPVYDSFFEPLFRGLLSVLMLVMGMEAWARLNELRKVAHWYAVYAFVAPLTHGLIAFGLGWIAHVTTGFSPGGVVVLAVIAGSSSDISGPPTLRAGIPSANPSAYVGSSTAVGTPVAIALGIPIYIGLAQALMGG